MNPYELNRMTQAAHFYELKGFKPIEVPWVVSPKADDATRPEERYPLALRWPPDPELRLPGSGEQGFIQMMLDGRLPPGDYQTVTPCFRDEPVIDRLHRPYFWKLELISLGPDMYEAGGIALRALEFFRHHLPEAEVVDGAEGTDDLYDIVVRGPTELGSYGIRTAPDGTRYAYGTGCAEPRLGTAIERCNGGRDGR